jgi:hypothetical protein
MKRKIAIWTICFVALIAWTGMALAQTVKPAELKTVKLANGDEVCDLNGDWDAVIEHYGDWFGYGTFPQVFQITQVGSSFTGIRMNNNPPPAKGRAGSKCMQGELDKNGFKKLEMIAGNMRMYPPSSYQISEDGNTINIDVPQKYRITLTRK